MEISKPTNRREFLKLVTIGASATAILAACAQAPAPTATTAPQSSQAPKATAAVEPTKPAATVASAAPTPTIAAKAVASGQVEIRFMNRGGKAAFDIHDKVIAAFMQATPNIKVKAEPVLEGNWDEKLLTAIASGTEPDTVMNGFGSWQAFAKRGELLDLSDYIKADIKLDDFLPIANQSEVYKGKYYSWHYNGGPYAIFYNKDIFDKNKIAYPDESWTWTKYFDAARKLTIDRNGKRPGESGFDPNMVDQYGCLNPTFDWSSWIWAKGLEVFSPDKTKILLDDPKVDDAIQELADMATKDAIWPNNLYPEAAPSDFVSGRVALGMQGYWMVARAVPAKFNWDVAPMPMSEWTNKRSTYGYYSGNSALKSTKHPDESWQFLKFFGGEPGQKILSDGGLSYPAVLSLAKDFKPTKPANVGAFMVDFQGSRFFEIGAYITEQAKFNQALTPVLEGIWLGKAKAKDTLPAVTPQLNAIIAAS